MVQFYFNSTYPVGNVNVKEYFAQTFTKYLHMYKQRAQLIEPQIITADYPSQININGTTLMEAIYSIESKEGRVLAINAFGKHPIDKFIKPVFWEEDGTEWDYTLNGLDAEDLYFAHRMDWLVLSIPVTDSYACDILNITHRTNPDKRLDIPNFYGDNELAILQVIDQREQYSKTPLATLVEDILAGYECKMTEEFVKAYSSLLVSAQTSVNEVFRIMHERGRIFPVIKADIKHIKRCVGFEGLFELRVLSEVGPRVYMRVDDGVLYIGYLGTKAESVGVEQTTDMGRAQLYINQLKERLAQEQMDYLKNVLFEKNI